MLQIQRWLHPEAQGVVWCAALSFTGQEHNPWARLSSQAANPNPPLERTSNRDSFSQHHFPRAPISQTVLQHARAYISTAGKKYCVKLKTSLFKNSLWYHWSIIWPIKAIKILSDNWFPKSMRARQDHASLRLYQYFSWLKTDTKISLEVICEANLYLRLWRLFSYSQGSRENQRLLPWEKVENHHWKFTSASSWGSWKEIGHGHWL